MDWTAAAAWVGAIGGLSGFASLGATALWRWQDQQKAKVERITLSSITGGSGGIGFYLRYVSDPTSEGLVALVQLLSGGRPGPFIDEYRTTGGTPHNPGPWEGPISRLRSVSLRLHASIHGPPGGLTAHAVVHGEPGPKMARIRVTVKGRASGMIYARRTLIVAPYAGA